MLVNIHDNKLQSIKSLSINLTDGDTYLNVETFRLIMLHYADNQVTDKTLRIRHNVNCENTAVLKYIAIVPEFFNSIDTTIETQLTNVSDLFLEACIKISSQTHITFKINIITMGDLPKIVNSMQKIKNSIPEADMEVHVEFSNSMCEWILAHVNDAKDLLDISQAVIGSSYYSNFINKEYYDEDILSDFFKLYFRHDYSDNVIISSLYTHLVEGFNSKIDHIHTDHSILINSDESISIMDLDNMITKLTKFNWNNISKNLLNEYLLDYESIGYESEFTNRKCGDCAMKDRCKFCTCDSGVHSINIPRNVCYNKLLTYKVWCESYSEFLRQLVLICNDNIQEKLNINTEAIDILNKLCGGKI